MNISEKAAIHFRKENHPYNSKKGNPTIAFLFFNKLNFAVINTALQTFLSVNKLCDLCYVQTFFNEQFRIIPYKAPLHRTTTKRSKFYFS